MVNVLKLPPETARELRKAGRIPEGEEAVIVTLSYGWLGEVAALADRLTPRLDVPAPEVLEAARRNAEDRRAAAEEFGLLAAEEVATLVGSKSANRSAAAYNLRRGGRIFLIATADGDRYPGFQFDVASRRPWPAVADILAALAPLELSGWELLAWFTAATGWLDDQRPVDLLTSAPARVVEAAQQEVGDVGF